MSEWCFLRKIMSKKMCKPDESMLKQITATRKIWWYFDNTNRIVSKFTSESSYPGILHTHASRDTTREIMFDLLNIIPNSVRLPHESMDSPKSPLVIKTCPYLRLRTCQLLLLKFIVNIYALIWLYCMPACSCRFPPSKYSRGRTEPFCRLH